MSDLDCNSGIFRGWAELQKLHLRTQSLISQKKVFEIVPKLETFMYLKWPETYRTTKGPPESRENPVILRSIASEESQPPRLRCFCAVLSKCVSSFSSNWFDYFF